MSTFEIPFDAEQMRDPETVRAIVDVTRPPKRPEPLSPQQHAGSFGAVIWGLGKPIRCAWGAGYGSTEDILRGYAVTHLIGHYSDGKRLIVFTNGLAEQLNYVRRSSGKKADGGDFTGFDVFKPIQQSSDRGEWELVSWSKKRDRTPAGHHLAAKWAKHGLERALHYQPLFSSFAAFHDSDHLLIETEQGIAEDVEVPSILDAAE